MAELENHYTTAQAAKKLGRSTKTLQNWRSLGHGPRYKRDPDTGVVIYPESALSEYIDRMEDSNE